MLLLRLKHLLGAGFLALASVAHADVAITPSLVDAGATVATGVPMTYTVGFKNEGDVSIAPGDGYTFQLKIPTGMSVISASCGTRCASTSVAGSVATMTLSSTLSPGQTANFTATLMPASTLAAGFSLTSTASVLAPGGASMRSVDDINTVVRQSVGYTINKRAMGDTTQARYAPGQTVTYSVAVSLTATGGNLPVDVALARITDIVPAQLSDVQWSCANAFTPGSTTPGCLPQSGAGNAIVVDVGGGTTANSTVTITVTGTLDAAATPGQVISNTAFAAAISPSPVTYSDTTTRSSAASFTVANPGSALYTATKSSLGTYSSALGANTIAQGDTTKYYTVSLTNYGPAVFKGALLDTVPSTFQLTNVRCSPLADVDCGAGMGVAVNNTSPTQLVNQVIEVPPGRSVTLYLYGTVSGSVGTVIDNTAIVAVDSSLTGTGPLIVKPAYKTTIVGQITINSRITSPPVLVSPLRTAIGSMPSYELTFENVGATDATNLGLSTSRGQQIGIGAWNSAPTWTCTATLGAVCPAASGTGNDNNLIASATALTAQIPVGGKLVFTITPTVPIPASLVPAGQPEGYFYDYAGVNNRDPSVTMVGASDPTFRTYVRAYNASVTKTSGVSSVVAGAPLSYTIAVKNNNNLEQPNLRVVDPLGGKMTNVTWSCTPSTACVPASGTGDIDTLVTIAANSTINITLSGNASPTLAPGSDLINTVSLLTSDGSPFSAATDTITVSAVADIGVVKTANLSSYSVGVSTPVVYTVAVTNYGQSTAVDTSIVDTAPAGITFNSWSCSACTTTSGTGNVNTTANIAQGQTVTVTINATVTAGASGTLTNTASSGNPPGYTQDPADNHPKTATAALSPLVPKLELSKLATPTSFIVGAPASYTLTVTNTGIGPTTAAAVVTDTVPTGLTLGTLPAGCSAAGQLVTCTIASGMAAGTAQSFTLPVTATLTAVGPVTNSASVSGGGDSACPAAAYCQASVNHSVAAPQLLLEKTAASDTFVLGVANSYTLKVTNQGSAATTAVATVTDTVPTELSLGTLPAGCTAAGQTVTCTIASGLSAGSYASFTLPVTPNATGDITNSASVSGGGDTACPAAARCSSAVSSNISQPQLQIAKTVVPATLIVNQPADYKITVSNIGAAATTADTVITDSIPTSMTLGSLPADCSAAGQVVSCTVPAGLAGGSVVDFVLPITPTVSGVPLSNTASATGGGDPSCVNPDDCASTITVNVSAPQLKLSKTASSAAFLVGQPASYTLSVLNQGTAATTAAATVTDVMPAQLTINTATLPPECTTVAQQVTCTVPSGLAVGASASFVIEVTAGSEQTGIVNTATVAGGGDPGCPADLTRCQASVTTDFNVPALTLVKTASSPYFTVGDAASYTLAVTNSGSGPTAVAATITDTIPAVLEIGTLPSGCTIVLGQSISCTVPAGLAVGATASFVIPVTPTVTTDVQIANRATVTGGGDPGCPAEPRCKAEPVESFVLTADLRINKTASSANFTLGQPASYTLSVTNVGTTATTTVATLTDVVPTGLTLGTMPAGCTAASQTVTCTIPAGLAKGDPAVEFVIPVTPTAAATGISNTAELIGGDPSCTLLEPCQSPTVTLDVQSAALSISKTPSSTAMAVGASASYTLSVTNTGDASTTAPVVVTDAFNSIFDIDTASLPAGCTQTGQDVSCTIAAGLAPLATINFTIAVTPTAEADAVGNTMSAYGGGDPNCTAAVPCTTDSASVDIVNGALLSVSKVIDQSPLRVGVPAVYTISVANNGTGPSPAGIEVQDDVPAGLTITGASAGCSISGQLVTCTIAGELAAQGEELFTINVTPTAALGAGTSVVNTVTVTGAFSSAACTGGCTASAGATMSAPTAQGIPTLSHSALVLLGALMLVLAAASVQRQRRHNR